ncbi:MAG TPA: hypothetical protein VFY25_13490 [Anaerolineales bacterium]|nr:hypothetical protein [Anaerolineales bacterium]
MYTVRLIVVFLIIVTLIFASSPITREQVQQNWENTRPVVVAVMDGVYAIVRTLIVGNGRDDRIDDKPVSPDVDFDRVVTMSSGLPS